MAYLVGTDEAGYGPNLGPLVISASVWQVPDGVRSEDLYERLAAVITATPGHARRNATQVAITDSKVLYASGKGLRLLERGLWAAWRLLGWTPTTCADVWNLLAGQSADQRRTALCDGCDGSPAPWDVSPGELDRLQSAIGQPVAAAGIRLVALRSRAVFPSEFNETVQRCGSKGAALSRWTLDLVARAMQPLRPDRISVLCDKHGGRDRYLPLLVEQFPDEFVEANCEGRQRSVYRFGPAESRVEICFQAKAESHMPTALASMASKYLRELAMRALCAFWSARVPGLQPTAGYPQDARRFKDQIAATQRELGIEDRVLWRVK